MSAFPPVFADQLSFVLEIDVSIANCRKRARKPLSTLTTSFHQQNVAVRLCLISPWPVFPVHCERERGNRLSTRKQVAKFRCSTLDAIAGKITFTGKVSD